MVNTSACKIIVSFLCLFKYDFSLCVNHLSNIVVFMTKVGIKCYIILLLQIVLKIPCFTSVLFQASGQCNKCVRHLVRKHSVMFIQNIYNKSLNLGCNGGEGRGVCQGVKPFMRPVFFCLCTMCPALDQEINKQTNKEIIKINK